MTTDAPCWRTWEKMLPTLSRKTTRVDSSLRLSAKMWASLFNLLPTCAVYLLVEQRITLRIFFSARLTPPISKRWKIFKRSIIVHTFFNFYNKFAHVRCWFQVFLEFLVPGYGKAVKSMFQRWECQSLPFEIGRPPSLLVTICNGIQLKLARKHFARILFSSPNPIEVLYRLGNWSDQAVSR